MPEGPFGPAGPKGLFGPEGPLRALLEQEWNQKGTNKDSEGQDCSQQIFRTSLPRRAATLVDKRHSSSDIFQNFWEKAFQEEKQPVS